MAPDIHLPGSVIALSVTVVPARGETSQSGEILASHDMLRGVYFPGIMSLRLDVQFPQVLIRSALLFHPETSPAGLTSLPSYTCD